MRKIIAGLREAIAFAKGGYRAGQRMRISIDGYGVGNSYGMGCSILEQRVWPYVQMGWTIRRTKTGAAFDATRDCMWCDLDAPARALED